MILGGASGPTAPRRWLGVPAHARTGDRPRGRASLFGSAMRSLRVALRCRGGPCLLRRSWRLAWERLLLPPAPGGAVFLQGPWYSLGEGGGYPSHGRLFDHSEAFRP